MLLSTTHRSAIPKPTELKKICQSIALLDAIFSPEHEYRYYTYNNKWHDAQELFQMNDGCGNEMLILFTKEGAVINGFDHELYDYEANLPNKSELTLELPSPFKDFIFGEPIASIGTTYCLWTDLQQEWSTGTIQYENDGSEDQLYILDGNPDTYSNWVIDYYLEEETMSSEMLKIITAIYQGNTLTKEMVLTLNTALDDWEQLKQDVQNINYPNTL